MDTPPDPSGPAGDLEDIRRQLRELGYLRTPVDRFLLGGRRRLAMRGRAAPAAAIRVAIVAGPILGALLVLFLLYHNYPHLHRLSDVAVLYLYSALLSGGVLFLAHLGGSLVVTRWSRVRGRFLPLAATRGIGFGLAAFLGLYLGWHWLGGGAGLEFATTPVRVTVLAGILVVGLWLGSVLARGLLGTLVRAVERPGLPAARHGHLLWAVSTFLPVAAVFMVWVLLPGPPAAEMPTAPEAVRPRSVSGRMVLLGIDGLDPSDLAEVWPEPGIRWALAPIAAQEPPAVWTSLLTGFPPERHGIHSVQSLKLMGIRAPLREVYLVEPLQDALNLLVPGLRPVERRPVNAGHREVKTVWEILAEHGRNPAALNWWATWPAAPTGNGIVVTERAYYKLLAGGSPEGETRPPELFLELQKDFAARQEDRQARAEALLEGTGLEGRARALLMRSLVGDMFQLDLADALRAGSGVDDLFVYLPGLDVVRTELFAASAREAIPGIRQGLEILATYHRFLADWIERLEGSMTGGDLLVVVGDPGRWSRGGRSDLRGQSTVLAVGSPQGNPERLPVEGATGLDLVPTVLALRGFPNSLEMPGRPLIRRAGPVPESILSYGAPSDKNVIIRKSAFDQEMLEQLRSLGYLH